MKIAIGIYGHYKNFERCKESILNLKNQYKADIFISSYNTKSFSDDQYILDRSKEICIDDFMFLSPKKVVLEKSIDVEKEVNNKVISFKKIFKLTPVKEILSRIISIRNRIKVLELINEEYDFIILIRPDTLFLKPIKLNFKKLNIVKLLNLFQDSIIAGPSFVIRELIYTIHDNFSIAVNRGSIITCPHKVLEHYSKKYNTNIIENAWVTLIPKDKDTVESREKEFKTLSV